jgi:hypothetical protein
VQLIYWDCGGAVVTEPIFYNTAPHLFDFFVRYNHASKEVCGHDPTVGLPTDAEERAARGIQELNEAKSLLVVTINDPRSAVSHRFVISEPCAQPDIPAGRWT